jgi:hypothetical protein
LQKRACVYGELDPFTGYIRQDYRDLAKLIRDLKFCCLFYDDVIVNTGVILNHPLTLPAFEQMSPFVQAGRLWTTGRDTESSPTNFINDRIDRFYGDDSPKKITRSISEVIDRWQAIAPEYWRMTRKLSVQVGSATQNILNNISALDFSRVENYHKDKIIAHIEGMHSEGIFDRDLTLAKIASMHGILAAPNLSIMSLLVQAELMNQATRNKGHDSIVLFPGMFLRKVHLNRTRFQQEPLPVDYSTAKKVISTFLKLGYSLDNLLSLPSSALYQLARSTEWHRFRTLLLSEQLSSSDGLERLSMYWQELDIHMTNPLMLNQYSKIYQRTPITTSSPWQLYSLANLGGLNERADANKYSYVLDLPTRMIYLSSEPDNRYQLSYKQSVFLSALICAGDNGVNTAQLKQLDIEETQVKHDNFNWYAHFSEQEQADESRMGRISVAKVRLNELLKNLKLNIDNTGGQWTVRSEVINEFKIQGSYWLPEKMSNLPHAPPVTLPAMSLKLWICLVERAPHYVNIKYLSSLLYDSEDKLTRKVSSAVYKLKKNLEATPYIIIKSCTGEYALISQGDPNDE